MSKISKKEILAINQRIVKNAIPSDEYEKNILNSWKDLKEKNRDDLLKVAKNIQKEYNNSKNKNTTLSIRINIDIKDKLKQIALETGLSYQSYLNMILHQIANGKLKTKLEFI